MAVKLRLTRVGKTKQPEYRIVAADSRSPRDGRFIEILGHYNPRTEPSTLNGRQRQGGQVAEPGRPADRSGAQAAGDLRGAGAVQRGQGRLSVSDDTGELVDDRPDDANRAAAPTAAAVLHHIVSSIVDDPDGSPRRRRPRTAAASASTSVSAPATWAG